MREALRAVASLGTEEVRPSTCSLRRGLGAVNEAREARTKRTQLVLVLFPGLVRGRRGRGRQRRLLFLLLLLPCSGLRLMRTEVTLQELLDGRERLSLRVLDQLAGALLQSPEVGVHGLVHRLLEDGIDAALEARAQLRVQPFGDDRDRLVRQSDVDAIGRKPRRVESVVPELLQCAALVAY